MEHNMVSKMSTLLRMGLVSKNNVRRATMLLQNPEKAMTNPAYRTLMQDILVDIMDRILNSKALYTAVRQNLVREPMMNTEGVEEDRTKTLLRSGLVPKKDIMVARRALSSPAKAKSMATVRAYRELMIDLLDSMVGKITGSPTLYNAFKQTMGKQKAEDMEESFEQPNEDTIAELLLHETAQELMEKNKPTKPDLWAQAKSKAKSKFKVYPSAYANGWAVKWYNEQGGGWKSVDEGKTFFGLRDELNSEREALNEAKYSTNDMLDAIEKAYKKGGLKGIITGGKAFGLLDRTTVEQILDDAKDFFGKDLQYAAKEIKGFLKPQDYAKHKIHLKEADEKKLIESEYKEVLTGYPNRGMNNDYGPTDHRNPEYLAQANAVLKAIGRYTFNTPSEAFLRIKTRLNLLMLDFPWTPYAWMDGGTGTTVLNVTRYGRVDGVDANTGEVRMDGRASPTDGFLEFNLVAQTEMADDGFYRVTARLEPKSEIGLPLEVEEETGSTQTNRKSPAQNEAARKRARELRFKLESLKGKSVKEEADLGEDYQTPAREREMDRKVQKHEDKAQSGYAAKMTKTGKAAARGRRQEAKHDAASRRLLKRAEKEQDSPRTYGRGGKLIKRGSRREVQEEIEAIEEMHKVGDTVKVPHKGKMVKGKIVRHDNGGSGKAAQHGGGYVVDVGEYESITVPSHKIVKEATEQIDELSKKTLASYISKRGSQLQKMTSGLDKYRNLLTGKQQANAVKGIKQAQKAMSVEEELIGGQKRLDVNKNKRLDAQDFKLLRVKKKPVAEAKMKQWTPRLDKLFGSSRDAVRSKPKKSKILRKIKKKQSRFGSY